MSASQELLQVENIKRKISTDRLKPEDIREVQILFGKGKKAHKLQIDVNAPVTATKWELGQKLEIELEHISDYGIFVSDFQDRHESQSQSKCVEWRLDESEGASLADLVDTNAFQNFELHKMPKHMRKQAPRKKVPAVTTHLTPRDFTEVELLTGETIIIELSPIYLQGIVLNEGDTEPAISGKLLLTNYRICFNPYAKKSSASIRVISIPLGIVDRITTSRTMTSNGKVSGMQFQCKDIRVVQMEFLDTITQTKGSSEIDNKRISGTIEFEDFIEVLEQNCFPENLQKVFAFKHRGEKTVPHHLFESYAGWQGFDQQQEFERLQLPATKLWRICGTNSEFALCESYPRSFITPMSVSDRDLSLVAEYRSRGRLPVLVWKHPNTSATLFRCSQPLGGIRGKKNIKDQEFFQAMISNNKQMSQKASQKRLHGNGKLYFMDARPKVNAMVNKLKGAGYESISAYENCEIRFLDIDNIHAMRKSFKKLRALCLKHNKDLAFIQSKMYATKWFSHLSSCLTGAYEMLTLMGPPHGSSIACHCSDGWDRTPQLCGLTKIMGDPFYRTVKGFKVLLQQEWLALGHKFNHRIGHASGNFKDKERSPIFLQFLDCVWQILRQKRSEFEFTEDLLLFLASHHYSCLYGDFLGNSVKERHDNGIYKRTHTIWAYIESHRSRFFVADYRPGKKVCTLERLDLSEHGLKLWQGYYLYWRCVWHGMPSSDCRGANLIPL
eukprot:TRINITY_DN9933_c0_g1_i1.p1 TRINITY_DN9933_c0_g1~~TRINITY_DN9933_c0_g1_i1.p1  ORF type:complete len:726 (+),score=99.52 TRINITY_DN9933_c0_g1_i1:348-2525(+)